MNDRVIRSLAQNWLARVGITLLATLGWGGVLCVVLVGITLIPDQVIDPDLKSWLFIGSFGCLMLVTVVGLIAYVLVSNRRIYSRYDEAFLPLGLTRSRYLLRGFQYQGTYRGRQVNVYYHVSGGRYLRVPSLEVFLTGPFRTRLGIGTQNALASLGGALFQQKQLEVDDPAYAGLLIYPHDEAWARELLSDREARERIVELVGQDTPGVRALNFSPESVRLNVRHFSQDIITPETVRGWLEGLLALAETAERLPPPAQTAEATSWEKAGRTDRGRFLLPAVLITVGVVVLCTVVTTGCTFGILILSGDFP